MANTASGMGGNSRKHSNHAHMRGPAHVARGGDPVSVKPVAGAGPTGQGMSGHIGPTTKAPSSTAKAAKMYNGGGGKSRGPAPAPKGGKSGSRPV